MKTLENVLVEYENRIDGDSSLGELQNMMLVLWDIRKKIDLVLEKIDLKVAPMVNGRGKK